MKFTSYEQVKNATDEELKTINIDDYNDEEEAQLTTWLMKAHQDLALSEGLTNLTKEEIWWYNLDNKYLLNKVINESPDTFIINGSTIKGREIITYPEFSIIKEDGKNNFYRIFK